MTLLFHATQLVVFAFMCSVTKNLWNVYATVRRYGAVPATMRRTYLREFYAMAALAVVAGGLVLASMVAANWPG